MFSSLMNRDGLFIERKKLVHMIRFNKFFDTLFLIVASILLSILIFSCGDDNDEGSNDSNNDSPIELDSKEDSTGNLIIVNQLTDQILLYHNDNILLKKIPALTRFRVYVPVDEVNLETLKVWKKVILLIRFCQTIVIYIEHGM